MNENDTLSLLLLKKFRIQKTPLGSLYRDIVSNRPNNSEIIEVFVAHCLPGNSNIDHAFGLLEASIDMYAEERSLLEVGYKDLVDTTIFHYGYHESDISLGAVVMELYPLRAFVVFLYWL